MRFDYIALRLLAVSCYGCLEGLETSRHRFHGLLAYGVQVDHSSLLLIKATGLITLATYIPLECCKSFRLAQISSALLFCPLLSIALSDVSASTAL